MSDITHSNQYSVRPQVGTVITHRIQSASENITELGNFHCIDSDTVCLIYNDSLPADNQYHFPLADFVGGGMCSPNIM